jgi:hypothetical protein
VLCAMSANVWIITPDGVPIAWFSNDWCSNAQFSTACFSNDFLHD